MEAEFKKLLGKTLSLITVNKASDEIIFETTEGDSFRLFHDQQCCEGVSIESVNGETDDLIGNPITLAEQATHHGDTEGGTYTWTFYRLATVKGYVDIRWHGESNGFYSEEVSFEKTTSDQSC